MENTFLISLNLFLAIAGAVFAYYKFFREGSHHQRIEFDIEFVNLGTSGESRVIEVAVTASNKGNVEQKFDAIRLTIRGIVEGQGLNEIEGYEPRLAFPEKIGPVSMIPDKYNYFFVRPGVNQRFPIVVKIPGNWCLIHARSTFKYLGLEEVHSAERAYEVRTNNA